MQITINRPHKRNAFTPLTGMMQSRTMPSDMQTCLAPPPQAMRNVLLSRHTCAHAVMEMSHCFTDARDDPRIGVIVLTGAHVR